MRLGFAEAASDLTHFLVGLEFDCSQIEHFDSYHKFCLVIHALVDLTECSASDLVVYDVFVDSGVGDGFACFTVLFIAEFEPVLFVSHL